MTKRYTALVIALLVLLASGLAGPLRKRASAVRLHGGEPRLENRYALAKKRWKNSQTGD